jgi:hypothetical protein
MIDLKDLLMQLLVILVLLNICLALVPKFIRIGLIKILKFTIKISNSIIKITTGYLKNIYLDFYKETKCTTKKSSKNLKRTNENKDNVISFQKRS